MKGGCSKRELKYWLKKAIFSTASLPFNRHTLLLYFQLMINMKFQKDLNEQVNKIIDIMLSFLGSLVIMETLLDKTYKNWTENRQIIL
jgi:hypothetical protein